jgi:hypothetical protein
MDKQQVFIQMALNAWNTYIQRTSKFIDGLSDEDLLREIAPGKNRIIYLLGHLIAIHDNMISLFNQGNRSYAHFDEAFVLKPDRTIQDIPAASVIRNDWKKSNEQLTALFSKMSADDWFGRHNSVSQEDFAKEPERNKLNVLINRTNHLAYHYGQLILAK